MKKIVIGCDHGGLELKNEIIKLNYRIAELEDRLCPCEGHDWKQVDSYITSFTCGMDFDTVYKY